MALRSAVDALLEAPVAPSFTRIGFEVRSRVERWRPLDDYRLDGQVIVLTGATSGLGRAAAEQLARCGASLVLVGRDRARVDRACFEVSAASANGSVTGMVADMGDLDAVRRLATDLCSSCPALDALVHNAGALSATREVSPQGLEMTVASQVVGPFLLTALLLDHLAAAPAPRVVTMSSGGMYASTLQVDGLQMGDDYNGTEQYARAKRAQVTLNEMWAARRESAPIVFHAVHPGWADTPGVAVALPRFRQVVGPLLRDPAQGADTMVWLVADDAALESTGRFWHDRRPRSIHRLPTTRWSDTAERRAQLWSWCTHTAGVDPGQRGPR